MMPLLACRRDGRPSFALLGQRLGAPTRIMRLQLRTFLVVAAVLALGVPAAARASSSDNVIRDCAQDGRLDQHYSQSDLQKAYKNLPSDIDEYTDCRQVIRAAMGGGAGSPGAPPPNGIVTPSGAVAGSSADVAALQDLTSHASKGKRAAVVVGGRTLLPGNAGLSGALGGLAGANGMPASLVLAIAALGMFALVTAYLAIREKAPLARRVAVRLFRR